MPCYIISYDVREGGDYEPLIAAIQGIPHLGPHHAIHVGHRHGPVANPDPRQPDDALRPGRPPLCRPIRDCSGLAQRDVQERMAQEVSMSQTESFGEKQPTIRRGRVDSLTIYEITDYELDVLAAGSPSSLYLNFAIFLLSVAASGLLALLTATFSSSVAQLVAIVLTVVGALVGALLLLLWRRSHASIGEIAKRIRARIPPQEDAASAEVGDKGA